MNGVILLVYITTGVSNYATGGPAMVNVPTVEACHRAAAEIKAAVGSKFDWYHCIDPKGKP